MLMLAGRRAAAASLRKGSTSRASGAALPARLATAGAAVSQRGILTQVSLSSYGNHVARGSKSCSWSFQLASHAFSSSIAARGQGESDAELSASLVEEIKYEKDESSSTAATSGDEPEFLTAFKNEGVWKVEEKTGGDEIALTREFGNEHIRVLFSIGDLDSSAAVSGMGEEGESGVEGSEESEEAGFPVRVAITISKPNQGALNIDAQAQDGEFLVEAISFYSDAKLASELTVEADWQRRGLYVGPQFETLDEKVQEQFYAFLEERGIAANLALFIPELAEWKEQREYCRWLENVKNFVDA